MEDLDHHCCFADDDDDGDGKHGDDDNDDDDDDDDDNNDDDDDDDDDITVSFLGIYFYFPIPQDNPKLHDYNIEQRIDDFIRTVKQWVIIILYTAFFLDFFHILGMYVFHCMSLSA